MEHSAPFTSSKTPKRPRSSLACIRCRKKKVKCDFLQPTCGRCAGAGLPCSYAVLPRRVDGRAFDHLGSNVDELKERMQKMQSDLVMMKSNVRPFADNIVDGPRIHKNPLYDASFAPSASQPQPNEQQLTAPHQQPVTWKLSLSPSGLRIDTNIASVADLYRILLNGISQLNINDDSPAGLFSADALRSAKEDDPSSPAASPAAPKSITAARLPAPNADGQQQDDDKMKKGGSNRRVWEVNDKEARRIMQEQYPTLMSPMREDVSTMMDDHTHLDHLVCSTYHTCFLSYQITDLDSFVQRIRNTHDPDYDPLLANSIYAWTSKHACIYHNACPDKDPTTMGETYFKRARQLLKKRFDISSPNTIHALINLYMYQLSCERSGLAYLYIGLAIRMAQDLKFHKKEFMPADPVQREANKRLWWSAYWLDLCAALDSNRPTMVDDKDCDLEYPMRLPGEDDEAGYRIAFSVHAINLMKVRKDIAKYLPSEQSGQSLLSAISRFENALTAWLQALPMDLRFFDHDERQQFQPSNSFRDVACLLLNIQYQTTWIMLHKFFLPKKGQTATPVALLSLNICTKAANLITRMLRIYAQHLPMCQFADTLDGIIASVTIHQVNAVATEDQGIKIVAQRNLILTADILRQSHLTYMTKVKDIISSIDAFQRKNNLSTDMDSLPHVDENAITEHSISSVFHPTPELSSAMPSSSSDAFSTSHASPGSSSGPSPMSSSNATDTLHQQLHQQSSASASASASSSLSPFIMDASSPPHAPQPPPSIFLSALGNLSEAETAALASFTSAQSLASVLSDPASAALFHASYDTLNATGGATDAADASFLFGCEMPHQSGASSSSNMFSFGSDPSPMANAAAPPPLAAASTMPDITSTMLNDMFSAAPHAHSHAPAASSVHSISSTAFDPAAAAAAAAAAAVMRSATSSLPSSSLPAAPSAMQQVFGVSSTMLNEIQHHQHHQHQHPSDTTLFTSFGSTGGLAPAANDAPLVSSAPPLSSLQPNANANEQQQQQQLLDMLEFITTGKRQHRDWDHGA
ncbi:fungal-specific transcription factor domain-containing protein, partial [Gongronella butleri]